MEQITIKEIAKLCGVGIGTVSRAINNHPNINPETKKMIMDTIKKYNYVPNNSARNLKRSDSNTIAVMVKQISNPFWGRMLQRMVHEVRKRNYALVLQNVEDEENEVALAIELEKEKRLKGIIFLGGMYKFDEEQLKLLTVPYVISGSGKNLPKDDSRCAIVSSDTEKESHRMVNYLCSCGHKRIALLTANVEGLGKCHVDGYKRALEENGIPYDESLIVYMKKGRQLFSIRTGYEMTKELLESGADFSCVYAISDTLAVGACKAIFDAGKNVPLDYSVAGSDGQEIAEYNNPSVTTMRYPGDEIAERTIKVLFDLMEKKQVEKNCMFPGVLLERKSTRKLEKVQSH